MLDAIPSTAAPRATPPAKAGQKPGAEPEDSRFQHVFGKADKPPGDRKDQVAAEGVAPETAAPKAAPALEVAASPPQPSITEAPVPPDEEPTVELPDSDEAIEIATLPPEPAPPPAPQADAAPRSVPAQPAELTESFPAPVATEAPRSSTASPVEPSVEQSGATQTRAVSPSDGVVPMTAAQTTERIETPPGGREVESRARPSAPSSAEAAELPSAPRAEPTAAASSRAGEVAASRVTEVTAHRVGEVPATPPAAADTASITGPQAASPAPAPQTLQSAAPAAPPPAAVIEQLVVAAKQNSDGRVDLTLSPAELGRVRMTLLAGETGITVAIHADRDDTLDLFRRNSDTLAQEFRQMGYGSVGFEFRGGGQSGRPVREATDDTGEIIAPEAPPPLPLGIMRLTGIGGLDIRL